MAFTGRLYTWSIVVAFVLWIIDIVYLKIEKDNLYSLLNFYYAEQMTLADGKTHRSKVEKNNNTKGYRVSQVAV